MWVAVTLSKIRRASSSKVKRAIEALPQLHSDTIFPNPNDRLDGGEGKEKDGRDDSFANGTQCVK